MSVRARRLGAIDFTGTAEDLARLFHETCERVAPRFMEPGQTVPPWDETRTGYREILVAVCEALLFGEQAGQPDTRAMAEEGEP